MQIQIYQWNAQKDMYRIIELHTACMSQSSGAFISATIFWKADSCIWVLQKTNEDMQKCALNSCKINWCASNKATFLVDFKYHLTHNKGMSQHVIPGPMNSLSP